MSAQAATEADAIPTDRRGVEVVIAGDERRTRMARPSSRGAIAFLPGVVILGRMQQTVLVALITGILTATAALTASWLTSRATIKAAQVNVTSNADTQRRERARDLRRSAYVDLLTYVTEIRWRVRDLITRAAAGDETALIEFRNGRNVVGGELARRRYVVYLEGPESIREPVDRLQAALDLLADDLDRALRLKDPDEIRAAVQQSRDAISRETHQFIVRAQAALTDTALMRR